METFLILLAIIFVPFIWFIWRMLRFTDETVGDDSPFARTITVHWSAERFFKRFDLVFAYLFMSMGMMFFFTGISVIARFPNQLTGFLIMFLFSLITTGMGVYAFEIQARLWRLIRHKRITFESETRQITIEDKDGFVTLTASDVARIEHHGNVKNYKVPIVGFDTFVLTNGNRYSIHDLFLPIDVVDYHFPGVPQNVVPRNQLWYAPENDTPITELCQTAGR
ncbi:MAG: hypothetical protein H7319_14220 [Spirosoma sp.]|nr:hypothetical protein [Spirosoma sp.]